MDVELRHVRCLVAIVDYGGFTDRHPDLQSSKGTIRLRPEDATTIPDGELRALFRSALDPDP